MFLTSDNNKHPLSQICSKGNHLWTGVEIHLQRIWFIVDFKSVQQDSFGEESIVGDTVLLSEVEDVLNLARRNSLLISVHLMTPPMHSRNGQWCIDRLSCIWEAPDPTDPDLRAMIYAKEGGGYHVDALLPTTADQLHDWERILELQVASQETASHFRRPPLPSHGHAIP